MEMGQVWGRVSTWIMLVGMRFVMLHYFQEDVTGGAVVFEDGEGMFLQAVSSHSVGCKPLATAEALAFRSALLFIGAHYQSSGCIFVDCQVLFCALNSQTLDFSEFGIIVEDCKQLLVDRPDIQI
ncbi:hypothetical protein JCGZ_11214 [Jatropha curcas]|uniref:RNase H type-1 domain-containing protein n=1 Tax=Jatropha curcas TaxID=180498 RepID=A0A067KJ52_JATCU|nr:hypothetical protein JCGZ_11214 [Jatropha curcas]